MLEVEVDIKASVYFYVVLHFFFLDKHVIKS